MSSEIEALHASHLYASLLGDALKEKEQQVSTCSHFKENFSQLRLEVIQQGERFEVELEGLWIEVQRLTYKLYVQKWDQAAAKSQLQESSSFFSTKAMEADELRRQVANLESELAAKAKTITGLEDQIQYQMKAVQDLVKAIEPPPPVGATFSMFPTCVQTSTSVFKDALVRADHAEKRVVELEGQCKGYQLRLSGVEKDLQASQFQVNEYILHAKKLELDGAREELAAVRYALELVLKNRKEQIAKVASFYQRDVAVKARVMMLNACFIQYPDFDWSAVRRHL